MAVWWLVAAVAERPVSVTLKIVSAIDDEIEVDYEEEKAVEREDN